MFHAIVNHIVEIPFESNLNYNDPFHQINLFVDFFNDKGIKWHVPAYWDGNHRWVVRFSPPSPGHYSYESSCSDSNNSGLHRKTGEITVQPDTSSNSLYKHGPLQVMPDKRHLQHQDGTPFLWLADTWWLGFTKRISFPGEFNQLVQDRLQKGYNVVQIVAGLYPDMNYYDERGANEAGFPWTKDFSGINPDYFDMVDLRISHMVHAGIVPCIVGSWGYFMDFAGMDVLKKHWEVLIARYSSYPVVWCAAGEALMDYYLADKTSDLETRRQSRRQEWSVLIKHIRTLDPYQRLVTIHPTQFGHKQLSDPELIDFDMLQTGHGGYVSQGPTIDSVNQALEHEPTMPILVSEVNYEGIGESSREETQRFHFWSCLLSGTMGHTYGANGLWQLNRRDMPYGPSPHGMSWGDIPWQEAAQLNGAEQIGLGKKFLEKLSWWQIQPQPHWISHHQNEDNRMQCYMAGIPCQLRLAFFPSNMAWVAWGGKMKVLALEPDIRYQCSFFDPKTGRAYDLGISEDSEFVVPIPPLFQDWVLVMKVIAE